MLERLMKKFSEPESQARLMRWFWVISTLFMIFGFVVIFYIVFLRG